MYDLAIIGGGASGLAAAVEAASRGASVIVLEKQERAGRKLLATGNGRCNFTNVNCSVSHYHGWEPDFTVPANESFGPASNRSFMDDLGVMSREEEGGKVYPYSLQGSAVLDMLREGALRRGVNIITSAEVKSVKKTDSCFVLFASGLQNNQEYKAGEVIIACGGKASPGLGGTDSGYALLKALGHRLTPLAPALTKIKTRGEFTSKLKGIKVQGALSLLKDGALIKKEEGEILFTDYGVSGPPALSLSRYLCFGDPHEYIIALDFLPELEPDGVLSLLQKRRDNLGDTGLELFLNGIINKKAGMLLLKQVLDTKLSRSAASLDDKEISLIAQGLKAFTLNTEGTTGWGEAQVTAGGIATADFDARTMESRLVPGLYACGEVLDIDGDCGGYNLQWAFAGGRLAAVSALKNQAK